MRRQQVAGLVLLGVVSVSCSAGVPYAALTDVPGLAAWHPTYQYRNTAANGSCQDGNDCRADGVLIAPSQDLSRSIAVLIATMRRDGWRCAVPHSAQAALLINRDGRRNVALEPVAVLARERGPQVTALDPGLFEAATRAAASHLPAIAVQVGHTSTPDKADLQTRPTTPNLCR